MKRVSFILVLLLIAIDFAFGTMLTSTLQLTKGVTKTIVQQIHEPEINLSTSFAAKSHIKGAIGEALTNMEYFKRLNYSGTWAQVSPREISQGLDHLYISFNKKNGLPDGCLIGESKYGSSKLKIENNDVVQMSFEWRSSRLSTVIDKYDSIVKELADGNYSIKKPALFSSVSKYPISLKSYFYKDKGDSKWYYFDGGDVTDIQKQTEVVKSFLEGVRDGKITSRNVIARSKLNEEGKFIQSVYKYNDETKSEDLLYVSEIKNDKYIRKILIGDSDVSEKLKKTFEFSDYQMSVLKKSATNKEIMELLDYNPESSSAIPAVAKRIKKRRAWGDYAKHSLISVAVFDTFDVVTQLIKNGGSFDNFDTKELLKVTARTAAITAVYEVKDKVSDAVTSRVSKKVAQSAVGAADTPTVGLITSAIDASLDFAAGYAIDTASIQIQRAKGLINKSIANKMQGRAVLVNGIPSVAQFALSFIPGVGPFVGQVANSALSIFMEFIVPDYDELSISVLEDMMKENPKIIEKWISERIGDT